MSSQCDPHRLFYTAGSPQDVPLRLSPQSGHRRGAPQWVPLSLVHYGWWPLLSTHGCPVRLVHSGPSHRPVHTGGPTQDGALSGFHSVGSLQEGPITGSVRLDHNGYPLEEVHARWSLRGGTVRGALTGGFPRKVSSEVPSGGAHGGSPEGIPWGGPLGFLSG
jgi:hypothetical protein